MAGTRSGSSMNCALGYKQIPQASATYLTSDSDLWVLRPSQTNVHLSGWIPVHYDIFRIFRLLSGQRILDLNGNVLIRKSL